MRWGPMSAMTHAGLSQREGREGGRHWGLYGSLADDSVQMPRFQSLLHFYACQTWELAAGAAEQGHQSVHGASQQNLLPTRDQQEPLQRVSDRTFEPVASRTTAASYQAFRQGLT